MPDKINCWEYKKCGREFNGEKVEEYGVCKAYTSHQVNKIHNGKNGGRCCWAVSGTVCGGKVQGIYAYKLHNCEKCDFYQMVHKEENEGIISPHDIIHKMNN